MATPVTKQPFGLSGRSRVRRYADQAVGSASAPVEAPRPSGPSLPTTLPASLAEEGPLPRAVRTAIRQALGAAQDRSEELDGGADPSPAAPPLTNRFRQAEYFTRRLLAYRRRQRLLQEECDIAREELADCHRAQAQSELVVNALSAEEAELRDRIEALQRERAVVVAQHQSACEDRRQCATSVHDATQRVERLSSVLDTLAVELQHGQSLLLQLVPGMPIGDRAIAMPDHVSLPADPSLS